MTFPRIGAILAAVTAAMLLGACAVGISGGGHLPSAAGDGSRATFAFNLNRDAELPSGDPVLRGTYHDRAMGVQFRFTGFVEGDPEEGSCVDVVASYVEQGRKPRGAGNVRVIACDFSDDGSLDTLSVDVLSGPDVGYSNSGTLTGGNFTATIEGPPLP